jgi:hypothetical protein
MVSPRVLVWYKPAGVLFIADYADFSLINDDLAAIAPKALGF